MRKIQRWFSERLRNDRLPPRSTTGMEALRIGLLTQGDAPDSVKRGLARLCKMIVAGGGSVVASDKDGLFGSLFSAELDLPEQLESTLGYGQVAAKAGFHIMANPRQHWGETLAGLGASGVEVMLGYVEGYPLAGHPLVPVLQVSSNAVSADDLDAVLTEGDDIASELIELIVATLAGEHRPRHQVIGTDDFQVTRGVLGVSF